MIRIALLFSLLVSAPAIAQDSEASFAYWTSSQRVGITKAPYDHPNTREAWGTRANACMNRFEQGKVGHVDAWSFVVLQVIDAKRMLILDNSADRKPFLVDGAPTKDIADQSRVSIIGPVKVDGTYQYVTAAGAQKTVKRLRLLTDDEADRYQAAEVEEAFASRWANEKQTWTDISGRYSLEAIYGGYDGDGEITLIDRNQSEVTVPISKLSRSDRNQALDLVKAEAAAKRKAEENLPKNLDPVKDPLYGGARRN